MPLRVAVPFYKNPHLVQPLFRSLLRCQDELAQLNARVVFYNDSPGDAGLQAELNRAFEQRGRLDLSVVENRENLGFVGTVNQAFDEVIRGAGDIVILNSDTEVFPGAIREMAEVAYSDPMIGFVSPRSNNATLATFPHGSDLLDLPAEALHERFRAVARHLPRITYAPVAVGYCLYIKGQILRNVGGFDDAYGKGYNEENDLICRANAYGYRAVLANHAYTYHKSKQSFAILGDEVAVFDAENSERLYARYPHYLPWVRQFFDSPEYYAERAVSGLAQGGQYRQRIGLDFSSFGTYHNGTFEHGKRLLDAADTVWPEDVQIVVIGGVEALKFHGMKSGGRIQWIEPDTPGPVLTAVFRLGQPFKPEAMWRLLMRAPVVGVWMLDTISSDCGYLRPEFDEALWFFTMKWADLIVGNSRFTADQLRRRYPIGSHTRLESVLLSTRIDDYLPASGPPPPPKAAGRIQRLLVIGNHFAHKALSPTVDALAEDLPDAEIVALGLREAARHPNVRAVPSGALSATEIDALFEAADAVVFPTHYEGFGFPVLHALARRRPIYVRRLPVFQEIAATLTSGGDNIHWFTDHQDLLRQLKAPFAGWKGGGAEGEASGWLRCAEEVYQALQDSIASASHEVILDRLRWFQAGFRRTPAPATAPAPAPELAPAAPVPEVPPAEAAANFIALRLRGVCLRLFGNRMVYGAVQWLWRSFKGRRPVPPLPTSQQE